VGNNEWLDIDVLDDYLEGKLDSGMMHKVERISLEDPFVAQALAGLTEAKQQTHTLNTLSILQRQLQERVAQKPVERKMWRITSHRLSIAATAAVLFVTVSILFWMRENHRQQQAELAANKNKNIEVNLKPEVAAVAPVDTVTRSTEKPAVVKEKVEQALDKTLANGGQALAKNKRTAAMENATLEDKNFATTKLQRKPRIQQTLIAEPDKISPPPVQALQGKVAGIQMQTNLNSVSGVVKDIQGRPIPGANIKMIGDDIRAITNVSGEFTLPVNKNENVSLEVASIGYSKKNIEAKANDKLNIRLEQTNSSLNEVVIARSSDYNKKNAFLIDTNAIQPLAGWESYESYLKQNNKLFSSGGLTVQLGFTIDRDGKATNIKLLKGQNAAMNKEAIRLLENGPKWKYDAEGLNQGSISIKF
jgi:hypothetical protein